MSERGPSSIVEVAALRAPADSYDVAILGGGLAGLTLAIQLRQARPETSIVVLEKREGPAPLAAFKVGESTVLAGAHYFAEVVGMRDHLADDQLVKLGLRFFATREGNVDLSKRPEKGPSDYPEKATFQIDRGRFENELARRARALGVEVVQGARVRDVAFGGDVHTVSFDHFGEPASTRARWVVDAAGRASFLKRKLGMGTDSGHHINSAWFRLAGGLDLEDWGAHDPAWMQRMARPGIRKYSTNHLIGEGYWIWLIPLSSGPISIGVCADPRFHPFEEINEFDKLLEWLRKHEPQLAASVETRVDDVEDFLRVKDYSFGVESTYSADRWSLVGEAGAFADPFYSPGSDFIALGNTLTTDLIVRDLAGEDTSERLAYFNQLYQRSLEAVMVRHRDAYAIYGNAGVAFEMLYWMTVWSHSAMTLLFVHGKVADLEFMRSVDADLEQLFELNARMHALFRDWNQRGRPEPSLFGPPGVTMTGRIDPKSFAQAGGPPPGVQLPLILRMLRGTFAALTVELTDDEVRAELHSQLEGLEQLAVEIFRRAADDLSLPLPPDAALNAYAIGLDPAAWKADGLFSATLANA